MALAEYRSYLIAIGFLLFTPVMAALLPQFQLVSHRILILGWGLAQVLILDRLITRQLAAARLMLCFVLPVLAAFGPLMAKLESPASRLAAQYYAPYLFTALFIFLPHLVYESSERRWALASNAWVLLLLLLIEPVNVQAGVGMTHAVADMQGSVALFGLLLALLLLTAVCTLADPAWFSIPVQKPADRFGSMPETAPHALQHAWLEEMLDPVICISRTGEVVYANPAWARTMGYGAQEAAGKPVRKLMYPDADAHQQMQLDSLLAGSPSALSEWVFASKGGEPRFLRCQLAAAGGPAAGGRMLIFQDLTSLRLKEWDLERKKSLLQEISFSASHKLRGPLSTLIGLLDYVAQHHPPAANGMEYIQLLQNRAQFVDTELIALSSLLEQAEDSQTLTPDPEQADLQACRLIWIIDDDRVTRLVHAKLIRRLFIRADIRQYADGAAAFEELRRHPAAAPQIIFLDLHMPAMDGRAFLESCRTLLPELAARTRIWLVSSSMQAMNETLDADHPLVSGYMVKPLTLAGLTARLRGWKLPVISPQA
ncbi:MAG: response regulator [Bacteroidia bacterium]|nr:response regulator [Bacteroidia bacterium]